MDGSAVAYKAIAEVNRPDIEWKKLYGFACMGNVSQNGTYNGIDTCLPACRCKETRQEFEMEIWEQERSSLWQIIQYVTSL